MKKFKFGTMPDGTQVDAVVLENTNGVSVTVITYGAKLQSIVIPDKNDQPVDVALGFDTLEGYLADGSHTGGVVGRCANRISKAYCVIDGMRYELEKNSDGNNIHSGANNSDTKVWEIVDTGREEAVPGVHKTPWSSDAREWVTLKTFSADREQGFPGNLTTTLTYFLTEGNELVMEITAVPDAKTVVNYTNHSYFNLNGHDALTLDEIKTKIAADYFTPTDATLIPTGELRSVSGTPMDFRKAADLGGRLKEYKALVEEEGDVYPPMKIASGYDHNFVINDEDVIGPLNLACDLYSVRTGIELCFYTDLPGVQLYTANHYKDKVGKGGTEYVPYGAFCIEPQFFPDSINNPAFANPLFTEEEPFKSVSCYAFSVNKD